MPSPTMMPKIDAIAMLSLGHRDYQSNFDFNKNKKYVESSELD